MPGSYKRALVTGATSGIGWEFAKLLAPDTALLLTGRDTANLAELKDHISAVGGDAETIAADLAEPAGRAAVIAAATAAPVDLVINNAGLGRFGRFIDNAPEAEAEMLAVNVTAVIEISRALLPGMIESARNEPPHTGRRAGMIVVSSTASLTPIPYLATYAATKAFERHWGEALAEELRGEPVDILVLCPGATRTEFFTRAAMATGMLRRFEEPDAVARKALAALGRRTVLISPTAARLATTPATMPRRLLTAAVGHFLRPRR